MQTSPQIAAQDDFRGRLARVVRLWHAASDAPLPRLEPGDPTKQLDALEAMLVDVLVTRTDPWKAADAQFQLAELLHGRPSDDPLRECVEAALPLLRRLDARRSGHGAGDARGPSGE
jgi:hypothetical protein